MLICRRRILLLPIFLAGAESKRVSAVSRLAKPSRSDARGVAWFIGNQEPSGLWNTGHNRPKGRHSDLWVGLAVCRMLNAIRGDET